MKKTMAGLIAFALAGMAGTASAFDLEDYATTYRATRDADSKAKCEEKRSAAFYNAMKAAYGSFTPGMMPNNRIGAIAFGTRWRDVPLKLDQAIAALRRSGYISEASLAKLERDKAHYLARGESIDFTYRVSTDPNNLPVAGTTYNRDFYSDTTPVSGCRIPNAAEILNCRTCSITDNVFTAGGVSGTFTYNTQFDVEDYAGTYRMSRDAYLKAANEHLLAHGPWAAARDAYAKGMGTYMKNAGCFSRLSTSPFTPSRMLPTFYANVSTPLANLPYSDVPVVDEFGNSITYTTACWGTKLTQAKCQDVINNQVGGFNWYPAAGACLGYNGQDPAAIMQQFRGNGRALDDANLGIACVSLSPAPPQ